MKDSTDEQEITPLLLRCVRCGADLVGIRCSSCSLEMRKEEGIFCALPPERKAHYAKFIADYEYIRAAEGRGNENEEFYLKLPYQDFTGKNSKQWHIRSRSYDYLVRKLLKRPNVCGTKILDLGAGNGWMSYRLKLAGYQPVAVDILTNNRDGLGATKHYQNCIPELFPRFQAELARLPFQDSQFDVIVFNASFHYAESYESSLREAFRCVKTQGRVIICDTPWYSKDESGMQMVAQRQRNFMKHYGTASNSIISCEYLTDERLLSLEERLSIRWVRYTPYYGIAWQMRPLIARLKKQREPSQFRIYVAYKN